MYTWWCIEKYFCFRESKVLGFVPFVDLFFYLQYRAFFLHKIKMFASVWQKDRYNLSHCSILHECAVWDAAMSLSHCVLLGKRKERSGGSLIRARKRTGGNSSWLTAYIPCSVLTGIRSSRELKRKNRVKFF